MAWDFETARRRHRDQRAPAYRPPIPPEEALQKYADILAEMEEPEIAAHG